MEPGVAIGASIPPDLIYLYTFGGFAVCLALEAVLPRRELQASAPWRWANNFSLSLLTWYLSMLASAGFVLVLVRWTNITDFGLVQKLELGFASALVLLLLVSQFLSYVVHLVFHKVSWLWPIHAVHHTDTDIDVSTSYRHHPLEPLLSLPLVAPLILLLGPPLEAMVALKIFEVTMTLFSHSNIRLAPGLDRVLRLFVLTPDFHRLHHCAERRYTDSNYGSAVPWFDYLFGTASHRPYDEQESMPLGLEYEREPRNSRLDQMITAPLRIGREE